MKRIALLVFSLCFSIICFGQIIYQDFEPNIYLEADDIGNSNQSFYLDLNKDSINDFRLSVSCFYSEFVSFSSDLTPLNDLNKHALQNESCRVKALNAGDQIWDDLDWDGGPPWHPIFLRVDGMWCNPFWEYKYAAVRLNINGLYHFGWIRIKGGWSIAEPPNTSYSKLYIADCAFNSTPEAGILAGDTVTSLIVSDNETELKKEISIYPNPVSDILFIENIEVYNSLSITNTFGKVIYKKKNPGQTEDISVENINSGVYFLRLQNSDRIITRKIIIQ